MKIIVVFQQFAIKKKNPQIEDSFRSSGSDGCWSGSYKLIPPGTPVNEALALIDFKETGLKSLE